jgi:thiamine transport system ATP-binding protein
MLKLQGITRAFEGKPVLKGISLDVPEGEILCLLGPSGCGKTTLLRIVAGLESADSGSVTLNGDDLTRVPVHQRGFGLMFQDFALFPHMNVAQNVAFGLRDLSSQEKESRVAEMLELVGLAGFEDRAVTELSGGEQQRVALARSLAPRPRLLMLDEPLGSLDAALRERLVLELRTILKANGMTALYVTHDQSEALVIGDRIAIMNEGRVEQIAPSREVYLHPETVFVAKFLGLANVYPAETLATFGVQVPADYGLLHPAFLRLDETGSIEAKVMECTFHGLYYRLIVEVNGLTLLMTLPPNAAHVPSVDETIRLTLTPEGILPLRLI